MADNIKQMTKIMEDVKRWGIRSYLNYEVESWKGKSLNN